MRTHNSTAGPAAPAVHGNFVQQYVAEFNSFAAMLAATPVHTRISALQLGVAENRKASLTLWLSPSSLSRAAADIVKWHDFLPRAVTTASRSPDGHTINLILRSKNIATGAVIRVGARNVP